MVEFARNGRGSDRPVKIAFLTRSLRGGGAERQVGVLAAALTSAGHDVVVVPFYAPGRDDPPALGMRVLAADKGGRWDIVPFLRRLVSILRAERPDVLHAYLPVANLLAVLLRPLLPDTKIVWGLRASIMELENYDWLSRISFAIERRLVGGADLMIANALAVRRDAVRRGYPAGRIEVVPNGIDVARFAPVPARGLALRRSWGVADDAVLVGMVGRLDPMKDHDTFFQALARVAVKCPHIRAVVVGEGTSDWCDHLRARAAACGMADRVVWTGWQADMTAIYSALDMLCLSSAYGEGFPNVVGEAMACAVPCVVTDIGDAAAIVAGNGRAVPARDPIALAAALEALAVLPQDERRALGAAARQRIAAEFGVDRLVARTLDALKSVAPRQ
jgi:glycosyltransferase involved in cell wall biosynthesis